MADEQKNSQEQTSGESTQEQIDTQEEVIGTEKTAGQQTTKTEQVEFVPQKDYKELQGAFTKSQQSLRAMEAKIAEQEAFQKKLQGTFGPDVQPKPINKKATSDDLRHNARRFRDDGYEELAVAMEAQADTLDDINEMKHNININKELTSLYNDLSKPESKIKPDNVDFAEVGQIAAKENCSIRAALGLWIESNLSKLTEPIVEREREKIKKETKARSLGGEEYTPMTDVEKEEIDKELTAIGDPEVRRKKK